MISSLSTHGLHLHSCPHHEEKCALKAETGSTVLGRQPVVRRAPAGCACHVFWTASASKSGGDAKICSAARSKPENHGLYRGPVWVSNDRKSVDAALRTPDRRGGRSPRGGVVRNSARELEESFLARVLPGGRQTAHGANRCSLSYRLLRTLEVEMLGNCDSAGRLRDVGPDGRAWTCEVRAAQKQEENLY